VLRPKAKKRNAFISFKIRRKEIDIRVEYSTYLSTSAVIGSGFLVSMAKGAHTGTG
jgi:hypothetical protein